MGKEDSKLYRGGSSRSKIKKHRSISFTFHGLHNFVFSLLKHDTTDQTALTFSKRKLDVLYMHINLDIGTVLITNYSPNYKVGVRTQAKGYPDPNP